MNSPHNIQTLAEMRIELEKLQGEVKELTTSTRALVEAWNAAATFVKFVRLIATVIAAVSAIWLFATHGFRKEG